MNMQSQQESFVTPNSFHFKVQFKDEFRRFSLQNPSFSALEVTLRSSYQIPHHLALKIKFQDDEKDWVVFSSDFEFQHALQLSGSPLRITFVILDQPEEQVPIKSQTVPAVEEQPFKRGPCGRGGRGRGGRGPVLTREEREAFKRTRISTRISLLESQLADPSLSSERHRAITWKLSKLREKLETLSTEKPEPDYSETEKPWRHHGHFPHHGEGCNPDEHLLPHGPCRGRSGRGRGCGRGRWAREEETQEKEDGDHILGKKWVVPKQTWIQFQESKENLRAARRSGDAEAIKKALEAFVAAKQMKKEHRYPKEVQ